MEGTKLKRDDLSETNDAAITQRVPVYTLTAFPPPLLPVIDRYDAAADVRTEPSNTHLTQRQKRTRPERPLYVRASDRFDSNVARCLRIRRIECDLIFTFTSDLRGV